MRKTIFLLALLLCTIENYAQTSLKTINYLTPQEYSNQHFALFSPDGKTILIGGNEGMIAKFNFIDPKPLLKKGINADKKDIYSAAYTPDGKYIVAVDGSVLYLLNSADLSVVKTIPKFRGVGLISISPDSKLAFIDDSIIDLESFAVTVKRLRSNNDSNSLFTADSKHLYLSDNYELVLINATTGETEQTISLKNDIRNISLSPDGKYIVAGFQEITSDEAIVKVFNTQTKEIKSFVKKTASGDYASVFSFLPDGKNVLFHTQESGNIFKLNVETGAVTKIGYGKHILSLSNNAKYVLMHDQYDAKIMFSELK